MSVFDPEDVHDNFIDNYLARNGYERIAQLMDIAKKLPSNGKIRNPAKLRQATSYMVELMDLLGQLRDVPGQVDMVVRRANLVIGQIEAYVPLLGLATTSNNTATTGETTATAETESAETEANRSLSVRLADLRTTVRTVTLHDRHLIAQSKVGVTEIDWQILMRNIPSIDRKVVDIIKDNIEAAINEANNRAAEALTRKTKTNKGASVKICVYYPSARTSDGALLCIRVKDKKGTGGSKLATEVLVENFPERTFGKKTMQGWAL